MASGQMPVIAMPIAARTIPVPVHLDRVMRHTPQKSIRRREQLGRSAGTPVCISRARAVSQSLALNCGARMPNQKL
jgi:hypothetical protein